VAGVVVSCEDSGEYYEPSQVWPDGPGRCSGVGLVDGAKYDVYAPEAGTRVRNAFPEQP
jgi:hypothetical protein